LVLGLGIHDLCITITITITIIIIMIDGRRVDVDVWRGSQAISY